MQQILYVHLHSTFVHEKKLDIAIDEVVLVFAMKAIRVLIVVLVVQHILGTRSLGYVKRRHFVQMIVQVEVTVIQKLACATVVLVEKGLIVVYTIADFCTDGVSLVMKKHVKHVILAFMCIQRQRHV
jgi:hypothetical protein